jgi:hypothetical protein
VIVAPETTEMGVPYEEIDCEIRSLVRLMNQFAGIHTTASCVGHEDRSETYVRFIADSQEHLRILMLALPFLQWKSTLVANQFRWQSIWIDTHLDAAGQIQYALRIAGGPQYMQRQALAEVEATLAKKLMAFEAGHPSYPTDVSPHNAGTE